MRICWFSVLYLYQFNIYWVLEGCSYWFEDVTSSSENLWRAVFTFFLLFMDETMNTLIELIDSILNIKIVVSQPLLIDNKQRTFSHHSRCCPITYVLWWGSHMTPWRWRSTLKTTMKVQSLTRDTCRTWTSSSWIRYWNIYISDWVDAVVFYCGSVWTHFPMGLIRYK